LLLAEKCGTNWHFQAFAVPSVYGVYIAVDAPNRDVLIFKALGYNKNLLKNFSTLSLASLKINAAFWKSR
jgi:hypothetical protein